MYNVATQPGVKGVMYCCNGYTAYIYIYIGCTLHYMLVCCVKHKDVKGVTLRYSITNIVALVIVVYMLRKFVCTLVYIFTLINTAEIVGKK